VAAYQPRRIVRRSQLLFAGGGACTRNNYFTKGFGVGIELNGQAGGATTFTSLDSYPIPVMIKVLASKHSA